MKIRGFRHKTREQAGFTLLEVIIALAVLFIGTVGATKLFTDSLRATSNSRDLTIATNYARSVMEELKSVPVDDLGSIYPDGVAHAVDDPSMPEGASWTVSYPRGLDAQPLEVELAVTWDGSNGESRRVTLTTLLTDQ